MAVIFRLSPVQWALRFHTALDQASKIKAFLIVDDAAGYELTLSEYGKNHLTFIDQSAMYLRCTMMNRKSPTLLVTTENNDTLIREPVHADASCFAQYIDFAGVDSFGLWEQHKYQKAQDIAVFTRVYNENLFIELFCRHYSKLTRADNIYLIDHESDDLSFYQIARNYGCQIVRIPRGHSDESNMKKFCSYFQRFLLTKYQWVIYADADEILVHEKGPEYLRTQLLNDDWTGIYAPQHGYEVFHHPDSEPELDVSKPIGSQRSYLHPNRSYAKPVITSEMAFWGPGFHYALNLNSRVIPDLWMIHLGHISVQNSLDRDLTRRKQVRSPGDKAMNIFEPNLSDAENRRAEIEKEHRDKLDQAHIPIPDWMRNAF